MTFDPEMALFIFFSLGFLVGFIFAMIVSHIMSN